MIMDVLVTGTTVAAAYGAGFWLGKTDRKWTENAETAEKESGSLSEADQRKNLWQEHRDQVQERLPSGAKRVMLGRAIGSPVTGEVSYFTEGTRRGALIHSTQGRLYAPASGKITRLYPTGNRMLLRTEYGIELLIQAGIETNELEGLYYRPRVVQNEIVSKGKLLLEYDPDGIQQEGYDPSVLMSVEDAENYRDITVSDVSQVKNGEDIMWVRK